jgi:hypothetical protein
MTKLPGDTSGEAQHIALRCRIVCTADKASSRGNEPMSEPVPYFPKGFLYPSFHLEVALGYGGQVEVFDDRGQGEEV